MYKKFIGIEIGGTKIQVFVTDENINILERHKFFVNKDRGASGIRDRIKKIVNDIAKKTKIAFIGVGYGGPVDHNTGNIVRSYQIKGWDNFNIINWLSENTSIPVIVDNDANTAALGESYYGAGKQYSRVLYITLGSGVGGGLIIDGNIYHGYNPGELEIGHIRLDKNGTILQDRCSGWAVDKKIRAYIRNNPDSIIAKEVGNETSGETKFLVQSIKKGDKSANLILEETTDDLAFGLSHVIHIVHPGVLILGGGLSLIGNPLKRAVEKKLESYLMDAIKTPEICIAKLKEDTVCIGAALMAKKQYESLIN